MKKISIVTLGCKVNQYESEEIAEQLERDGYETTMGLVPADIYIINTILKGCIKHHTCICYKSAEITVGSGKRYISGYLYAFYSYKIVICVFKFLKQTASVGIVYGYSSYLLFTSVVAQSD